MTDDCFESDAFDLFVSERQPENAQIKSMLSRSNATILFGLCITIAVKCNGIVLLHGRSIDSNFML